MTSFLNSFLSRDGLSSTIEWKIESASFFDGSEGGSRALGLFNRTFSDQKALRLNVGFRSDANDHRDHVGACDIA